MRLSWFILPWLAFPALASPDLSAFPKWTGVVAREHVAPPLAPFSGDMKPLLDAIHAKYQRVPYVEDRQNYGVHDHWASRAEMRAKGAGDCEDFAIAGYFDLLEAGVPERELWVMVARLRSNGEIHAVLRAGEWVLDRRLPGVVNEKIIPALYTPIYSINREGWRDEWR